MKNRNEELKRNYDFYQTVTLHHSSLSTCIFGILASQIGYDDEAKGMDYKTCKIEVVMDSQSSDIALGTNEEVGGAGDQGIMFGYATKETEGYMPLAISIAHHLVRYASTLRHEGTFKWARPDMKAQVTIDYTDEKPVIDTILMSIQHDDDFNEEEFKKFM